MKNNPISLFLISVVLSLLSVNIFLPQAIAKDKKELTKCICSSKTELRDDFRVCIRESKEFFLKENKYSDYIVFLRGLCNDNTIIGPYISYYIALARYEQLKFLEENNSWDEYFAKGNDYRDDIVNESDNCIKGADKNSPEYIYAQLLLYKFHKDQQDSFADDSLEVLLGAAGEYSKSAKDILPIKEAADTLLSYQETSAAKKLYNLYTQALISSSGNEADLKDAAMKFYKEGNLDLSESIFTSYIGKIKESFPKDKFIEELKEIARLFSYKDGSLNDIAYAENIFKSLEEAGGLDVFNEELIYMRGFNLEKNKDFKEAKEIYNKLLAKYPNSKYYDKLVYKVGLISTYALRDAASGRENFGILADKKTAGPYSFLSLYQLGLLKQWSNELASAKGYYSKLIEKANDQNADIVLLAKSRLQEIEDGAGIMDNSLKTFIDAALKQEYINLNRSKVDVKSDMYNPQKEKNININSSVYLSSSGCFHVELSYLWSGELGLASPNQKEMGFNTSYKDSGTKMVGLVLVSPSGVEDYNFDLVDVD